MASRRLRIPAALVVSIAGASATAAVSFGGCNEGAPEPLDALGKPMVNDSGVDGRDSTIPDEADVPDDGPDARISDAAPPPDTPIT